LVTMVGFFLDQIDIVFIVDPENWTGK
jgi:hypothetical protein